MNSKNRGNVSQESYLLSIASKTELLRILRRFSTQDLSLWRDELEKVPSLAQCWNWQLVKCFFKANTSRRLLFGFWRLPWAVNNGKMRIF